MNIGIDLGGSHIGIGIVEKGKIIKKVEKNIVEEDKNNIEKFLEKIIVELIEILLKDTQIDIKDIGYIGIASPGTIKDGKITNAVNLNVKEIEVGKIIKKYYNKEVKIKNDGKCAGIAEKKYGSLKEYEDALFLCLGTGIGGAIFINNKLVQPKLYDGMEFGHMIIIKNGEQCKCGNKGCFETYGSMKNLKRKITKILNIDENALSYEIIPLIKNKKNTEVDEVIKEYVQNVAIGISNLINIFEPEVISIGGSFSYYSEILLEKIINEIQSKKLLYNQRENLYIRIATLYNDAGIIGAANQ